MKLDFKGAVAASLGWALKKSGLATRMFLTGADADGDMTARLSRPMERSVWVMRAIKKVALPISAVSIQFGTEGRRAAQIIDPALSAFWNAPARGMGRAEFIEATVGWLKLAGEAFWVMDDSWLLTRGQRSPLILARPDRMRPVVDASDESQVLYWELQTRTRRERLLPEQVIQIKNWNPYNPVRGLAEWEAAAIAAEADWLTGKFARDLMANNGDRGVYVIAKGQTPDEAQQRQITAALQQKRELASRGMFRPVFLGGDMTIEDSKVQAVDANLAAQRLQNRHEIAIAFGVPPSMFDLVASYSIGAGSDRFILIEETCMPTGAKIEDAIEAVTARLTGRSISAWFNWDEHSTMQAVRRERVDSAVKLAAVGMPMAKVNDYLDMGLPQYEGWDTGYVPFTLQPVSQALAPVPEVAPVVPPAKAADPVTKMLAALAHDPLAHALTATVAPAGKTRDPKRVALWRSHMAARRGAEKRVESKISGELMKARGEMLRNLSQADLTAQRAAIVTRDGVAADIMFDLPKFKQGLKVALRKVAAATLQEAGDQLYGEIAKDDPWTMPSEAAKAFLDARDNLIGDASEEIFDQVKGSLQDGLDGGETMEELTTRVKDAFNGISRGRARVIATTETSAAYGAAREEAMKEAGIQFKQWLTAEDDAVRATHAEADGQTVGMDEDFTVGGESLAHPGDPRGSAENVINCRCVQIAVKAK